MFRKFVAPVPASHLIDKAKAKGIKGLKALKST